MNAPQTQTPQEGLSVKRSSHLHFPLTSENVSRCAIPPFILCLLPSLLLTATTSQSSLLSSGLCNFCHSCHQLMWWSSTALLVWYLYPVFDTNVNLLLILIVIESCSLPGLWCKVYLGGLQQSYLEHREKVLYPCLEFSFLYFFAFQAASSSLM